MLLEAARHSLDVEFIRTLAAADAAGDHHLMRYPSTVAYLTDRPHRRAPGQLLPEDTQATLRHLEIVGGSFEETKRTVDYWRHRVDPAGMRLELEEQLRRRRFEVSRRANGMVWGEFELPSLAGETLLVALDALMPPRAPDEARSTSQRRTDALEDLGRSSARDRHCTWPGCTRSPRWCDVHHLVSWADHGETEITNLCLLCRYRHTLTHLEINPDEEARLLERNRQEILYLGAHRTSPFSREHRDIERCSLRSTLILDF